MPNDNVSPLPVEHWAPSLADIADDMNGAPINVHKLMANNPELLNAWWNFRNYSVNGGTLGPRLGELVILRVGVQLAAWYEWGSHVDRSLKCGLSMGEINSVACREIDPDWPAPEAALLQAVDDLIETHQISPQVQDELSKHFEIPQIMDIIAIHGMYVILGCMIKTWGLELDPEVAERIAPHTSEEQFNQATRDFHSNS
ncbi:carboxymuconolactone decarboxylase family protein [Falsihalocynthiibacter sp. SS001]|uniref:carboxymuconolactone decarboxylase family protein n=1 Tax=Falsihalocynthiibacter sp. SS001 TaxID=3349698 RepID=UPI0036D3AB84